MERTIVVLNDEKPVTVRLTQYIRVTGTISAGGKITINVTGPAKIENINSLLRYVDGRQMIGATINEFELKPIGEGNVKVVITTFSPTPKSEPQIKRFEFDVKAPK